MDFHAIFVRNVVFPLMEKYKGNKILYYLDELQHTNKLCASEIEKLQKNKLHSLIKHCVETVPKYKKYNDLVKKNSLSPDELLKHIHICLKSEVRNHGDDYISTHADKNAMILNRTGGSTGQPTEFYMDRKTVEYYEAARWRALSWWGIKPGDKVVMILGNPVEYKDDRLKRFYRMERLLKNRVVLPGYDLKKEQILSYVKIIKSKRPVYLYGYTSAIYMLSKYIEDANIEINVPLKGIVTTAETLYPYQREQIEKVFQTNVINEYGAKDGGIIAYQCPKSNLHLTSENVFVEVIDPVTRRHLNKGEVGELIITDLNNYSMPRLRYEIGDMGSLSNSSCSCGCPLPLLEHLEGRTDDMLISPDGNFVPGHYFAHIAGHIKGIEKYQIIQKSFETFVIKLIKNDRFKQEEVDYLIQSLKDKMQSSVNIQIEHLDYISPTKSGKYRVVFRENFSKGNKVV